MHWDKNGQNQYESEVDLSQQVLDEHTRERPSTIVQPHEFQEAMLPTKFNMFHFLVIVILRMLSWLPGRVAASSSTFCEAAPWFPSFRGAVKINRLRRPNAPSS